MSKTDYHNQTTLEFAQGGYLSIAAESFITDRKAANLARHTILFYRNYLREFLAYCDGQAITHSAPTSCGAICCRWKACITLGVFMLRSELCAFFSAGWKVKRYWIPNGKTPSKKSEHQRLARIPSNQFRWKIF